MFHFTGLQNVCSAKNQNCTVVKKNFSSVPCQSADLRLGPGRWSFIHGLRCRYVRLGQGFEDFLNLHENVFFLAKILGGYFTGNPVLLPYLYIIIILVRSPIFISNSISHILKYKYILISRVTENYSTSKHPIPRE